MVAVVAEDRLRGAEALLVEGLVCRAIDLLFHLLGKGIFIVTDRALEEGDLAYLGTLGVL